MNATRIRLFAATVAALGIAARGQPPPAGEAARQAAVEQEALREKSGEIRFRRTGFLRSRIEGQLRFADEKCTFTAREGTTYDGIMQCPGTRGVPFSLKVE